MYLPDDANATIVDGLSIAAFDCNPVLDPLPFVKLYRSADLTSSRLASASLGSAGPSVRGTRAGLGAGTRRRCPSSEGCAAAFETALFCVTVSPRFGRTVPSSSSSSSSSSDSDDDDVSDRKTEFRTGDGLRDELEVAPAWRSPMDMDGRDEDGSRRDAVRSLRDGGRATVGLGELFLRASLNAATLMRWEASEATLFPLGRGGGVMNEPDIADGGRGAGVSGEEVLSGGPTCLNDFKLKESELYGLEPEEEPAFTSSDGRGGGRSGARSEEGWDFLRSR